LLIFCNRPFARFAKKTGITGAMLREAVNRAERGLIDADLGGGVIKQRIARSGSGKSGGYRTVILYRHSDKAFFVYGYPKNERSNLDSTEEREFKELARITFGLSRAALDALIAKGTYTEVEAEEDEQNVQE